jgi:tryptophan-rich sensory protein
MAPQTNAGTPATSRSRSAQAKGLAACILLALAAASLGAVASVKAAEFYHTLSLPSWAPSSWLFGPVWTLLYVMMGTASWLVWRERGIRQARGSLSLYAAQLAANALWSWLFFAWHKGQLASLEVAILWLLIAATLLAFWKVRPLAGLLLVPYLAWVTFASVLCFRTWQLNPAALS